MPLCMSHSWMTSLLGQACQLQKLKTPACFTFCSWQAWPRKHIIHELRILLEHVKAFRITGAVQFLHFQNTCTWFVDISSLTTWTHLIT